MTYVSATITCIDCGKMFEFSQRDSDYYEKMGFEKPKRCRDCRTKKKEKYAKIEEEKKNRIENQETNQDEETETGLSEEKEYLES